MSTLSKMALQMAVRAVVMLAEPLSITFLATLLEEPTETIAIRPRPLRSVLQITILGEISLQYC